MQLFGGPEKYKAVQADRARVKEKFAGFERKSHYFPYLKSLGDENCRKLGKLVAFDLEKDLSRKQPVEVSMILDGLEEWGQGNYQGKSHAWHSFLIVGYYEKNGEKIFLTRNSWGGAHPEVPESRLCRVNETSVVTTASDPK